MTVFMLGVLGRQPSFAFIPATQPFPPGDLRLATTAAGAWGLPVSEAANFSTLVWGNYALKLRQQAQLLSDQFPSAMPVFWGLAGMTLVLAVAVQVVMPGRKGCLPGGRTAPTPPR